MQVVTFEGLVEDPVEIPSDTVLFPLSEQVIGVVRAEGPSFSNETYKILLIDLILADSDTPFHISLVYQVETRTCFYTHPVRRIMESSANILNIYSDSEVLEALEQAKTLNADACQKMVDDLSFYYKPRNLTWIYKTYYPVRGLGLVVQLERRGDFSGARVYARGTANIKTYTFFIRGPSILRDRDLGLPYTTYCQFAYKIEDALKVLRHAQRERKKVFPDPFEA